MVRFHRRLIFFFNAHYQTSKIIITDGETQFIESDSQLITHVKKVFKEDFGEMNLSKRSFAESKKDKQKADPLVKRSLCCHYVHEMHSQRHNVYQDSLFIVVVALLSIFNGL